MKTLIAAILLTISSYSFSQDKIPAVDINNPPTSAPNMSVSTVEEPAVATTSAVNPGGCTMNFANQKSLFIQDKKRFKKMTDLEKDYDKQILKQGVVMGNGTEVRFVKEACTHYILVISLTPRKIQNAMPHHLYRQTLHLLEEFQVDRQQLADLYPLKKSLVRNNWALITEDNGQYILPCVGAKCTLKVEGKDIVVTYDMK